MCGRFTFAATDEEIQAAFPEVEIRGEVTPRYNVAPTQPVAVIPNVEERYLDYFVWGLIPSWAKDPKIGNKMINARGETAADKRRRCLIPATGFYEWKRNPDKSKTPMYIHMASGEPFAFAGLWEIWHSEHGDQVFSCTIITTTPNELLEPIHNRMPVILNADDYDAWLSPVEQSKDAIQHLIRPFSADRMEAYPVSPLVNRPVNDSPELIQPT